MKKVVLLAALMLGAAVTSNAQVTVQGSKFSDNWSLTLKGGIVSPLQHYAFFGNARGVAGLELRKQVTSVLGLGIEGEASFNTSSWNDANVGSVWAAHSGTVIDHSLVGAFGTINLSNWFGGYAGAPRAFEVETVLGTGWWHGYKNSAVGSDDNAWYTKAGLNFNFNLGESKAWTVALKPAVVWNMDRDAKSAGYSRFNANGAAVELEAGITYHFGNSNGQHYMTICPNKYTQADLDAVNAKVNDLRGQLSNAQSDLDAANARNAQLARDLEACKAQKNKVVEVKSNSESLETNVFFDQGKSVVKPAQLPNVERVATFLKNHKDTKVEIKGYASPEGSQEINEKIAKARAEAVKTLLVNKYKISADRISAEGQGVGNMFSEPDWNRVSICTLVTGK